MKIAAGPCFAWTGRTGTARLVILHDFPTSGLSMVAHGCAGATIHGMLIMDGANRVAEVTGVVGVYNAIIAMDEQAVSFAGVPRCR